MTQEREKELIELAGRAFEAGYTESQVVALIEAEYGVGSEDQAVEIVNKAK
jgi:hypothetical protein